MNGGHPLYERGTFTVPASNGGKAEDCEVNGHIPAGPKKRRSCLRCGIKLTEDDELEIGARTIDLMERLQQSLAKKNETDV